jgi:hypothetical protein
MIVAIAIAPNGALLCVLVILVAAAAAAVTVSRRRSSNDAVWLSRAAVVLPPALALLFFGMAVNVKRHSDARRLETRLAKLESVAAHAEAELTAADDAKQAIARASDRPMIVTLPPVEPSAPAAPAPPPDEGGRIVVDSASFRLLDNGGTITWEAVVRKAGDTPGQRNLSVELLDVKGFLVESLMGASGLLEPGETKKVGGQAYGLSSRLSVLVKAIEVTVRRERY